MRSHSPVLWAISHVVKTRKISYKTISNAALATSQVDSSLDHICPAQNKLHVDPIQHDTPVDELRYIAQVVFTLGHRSMVASWP